MSSSPVQLLVAKLCIQVVIQWDGSDRNNPASIEISVDSNAFDVSAGAYVQQRPGFGDWHEVASFTGLSLDERRFFLSFRRTGGQNYTIWIPINQNISVSDVVVSTSGPYRNSGIVIGNFPFPA